MWGFKFDPQNCPHIRCGNSVWSLYSRYMWNQKYETSASNTIKDDGPCPPPLKHLWKIIQLQLYNTTTTSTGTEGMSTKVIYVQDSQPAVCVNLGMATTWKGIGRGEEEKVFKSYQVLSYLGFLFLPILEGIIVWNQKSGGTKKNIFERKENFWWKKIISRWIVLAEKHYGNISFFYRR